LGPFIVAAVWVSTRISLCFVCGPTGDHLNKIG
jgi:hypothetical protein